MLRLNMKYACYDCDRKGIYTGISSNINQRFIIKMEYVM